MDIELKNEEIKKTKNFDFIDTIRCISMIGIVFEHSSVLWGNVYESTGDRLIQASAIQFFKFATIVFFIISGFLLNHKFTEYSAIGYLKNRFKNTIGPWLFWVMVLVLLNLGHMYFMHIKSGDPLIPLPKFIFDQLTNIIFHTSFWFIFNFLICISILLLFKKYLFNISFGILLGCVSLFYSLNLYFGWIITEHTTALFGFVFYLWLGVYINKYYHIIIGLINRISWFWLITINVMLFAICNAEILFLMDRGSIDSFNTLRVSNILYSIGMFFLLLKVGPIIPLQSALKPRQTTFGIYLIHQIFVFRLLPEIFNPLGIIVVSKMTVLQAVSYTLARFFIVYVLSFLIVSLILRTKGKWIIGAR